MGYRPTICCREDSWEFGKFYGYVKLDNLKSIKWLIDHNKLEEYDNDPDIAFGTCGPEIVFTANEFREFIDLYQEDINNYDYENNISGINYTTEPNFKMSDWWSNFDEVYNNEYHKIIYWG